MRQVMGLAEVVENGRNVEKVRDVMSQVVAEFLDAGVVSGDVALGVVQAIRYFCELRIAHFNNQDLRRMMAEMLVVALEQAVCQGSEVSLLDD